VEKDGSGDFLEIQDAVLRADDGDTIRIGIGRWSRMVEHIAPAWQDSSVVVIEDKGVTLLGAGIGATIIGPAQMPDVFNATGPFCILFLADAHLEIQDMTIENAGAALYVEGNGSLNVINAEIAHARLGVTAVTPNECYLYECYIHDCQDIGIGSWIDGNKTIIERCDFVAPLISTCFHTMIQRSPDYNITECNYRYGAEAIQTEWEPTQGTVTGIVTSDVYSSHIIAYTGSIIQALDCRLGPGGKSLLASSGSTTMIRGSGNILYGVQSDDQRRGSIYSIRGDFDLHDNHILRQPGSYYAVGSLGTGFQPIDVRNNWWGTTDTDSIAAWIYDYNDDPGIPSIFSYEPVLESPVPAERTTTSSLKRAFR